MLIIIKNFFINCFAVIGGVNFFDSLLPKNSKIKRYSRVFRTTKVILPISVLISCVYTWHSYQPTRQEAIHKQELARFLNEAEIFMNECKDVKDFKKFESKILKWANTTYKWIDQNIGPLEAQLFKSNSGLPSYHFNVKGYNKKIDIFLNYINKRKIRLEEISKRKYFK